VNDDAHLAEVLANIPASLRDVSGTALYTGRGAWTGSSRVYLLGYNPGGAPGSDTIAGNLASLFRNHEPDYSEYRDGLWGAPGGRLRPKGAAPMQRRVMHLFDRIGVEPGSVPASNVIFARSARVATLDGDIANGYAEECWPFHSKMIEQLGVEVIVCMGRDAARFVRSKVGAHDHVDTFTEDNGRRWKSYTFRGPGPTVVQLTHPGIAAWTVPATDPTGLVVRALEAQATSTT
jgi:hypothetical protein